MTTLWEGYRATAERAGDHTAIVGPDGAEVTHRELARQAEAAAAGLRDAGLGRGDLLGLFLPNRVSWCVAALATARSGIGILGLNTRFREAELDHLLGLSRAGTVLLAHRFLGVDGPELFGSLPNPPRLIVDGPAPDRTGRDRAWSEITAGGPTPERPRADDPSIGFTTSGTTGFPKIALHTNRQTRAHLDAVVATFGLGPATVALVPLPLCGAFGYTTALATLLAGGTVVLDDTWDPDRAAGLIGRYGVTWFNASDDMLLAVEASPRFVPETTWRTGGFADFTNAGARAVHRLEASTGGRTRLAGLYGSSEGFALMASFAHRAPAAERARNGGHVVSPDLAVRACDPETGAPLPHHEPGELQFRGPGLIDGYLHDPIATDRAFTDDGWYRSGDLGTTIEPDDRSHPGFVYLARMGDALRLRGFLCDPAEIEAHLERHPAVDLAQVVGVTRPGIGDVAVAFVRLAPDPSDRRPGEADLRQHCADGLANYKRPERIVVVDDFPVTDGPNGVKIRKVDLRQQAAALLAAAD